MSIWRVLLCVSSLAVIAFAIDENSLDNPNGSSDPVIECPTWYHPAGNGSSMKCVCGNTMNGKITCLEEENEVRMSPGVCMTYTNGQVLLGVGPCTPPDRDYTLPKNVSALDKFMCGSLKRTGLLCSECQEGFSLAAMSYRRECVECSNPVRGMVLFVILCTIPPTVFFLLVMMCSVDISSGPLNAVLVVVHVYLANLNEMPSEVLKLYYNDSIMHYIVLFQATFFGIWNLDFLRYVIPPFCISRSLTSFQAEALEYIVAVYPLLLIVVTYICVEMYDKDYRIMVALWKPFKMLLFGYMKKLNVKYSLIKAFATFLILSYTKIFSVSRNLLVYISVVNSTGDTVETVLVMDASTPYLSATHIPYITMAISMVFIFNLIPLFLLLLYPTKCFQHLLGKFPSVNWHPLHAFTDIFQGCYKNGTDGTRDLRYFSAFNLLLRIIMLLPIEDSSIVRICIVLIIFIAILAITKPYRQNILNCCEITIYSGFLLYCFMNLQKLYSVSYFLIIIYSTYFCAAILVKILKTISPKFYSACADKIKKFAKTSLPKCCHWSHTNLAEDMEIGDMEEGYPDRVSNPQDYEPMPASSHQNLLLPYGSM